VNLLPVAPPPVRPRAIHLLHSHTPIKMISRPGLYELQFYEPHQSPTELPSPTWWLEGLELGGVYARCYAWVRVANAERLVQVGF